MWTQFGGTHAYADRGSGHFPHVVHTGLRGFACVDLLRNQVSEQDEFSMAEDLVTFAHLSLQASKGR